MAYSLPNEKYKQYVFMSTNYINPCGSCVHVSYCVLTHHKNEVISCSEFDEIQQLPSAPFLKIKKLKPELEIA